MRNNDTSDKFSIYINEFGNLEELRPIESNDTTTSNFIVKFNYDNQINPFRGEFNGKYLERIISTNNVIEQHIFVDDNLKNSLTFQHSYDSNRMLKVANFYSFGRETNETLFYSYD